MSKDEVDYYDDFPNLPDGLVWACPECGNLVLDYCFHDLRDDGKQWVNVEVMSVEKASKLRVAHYHALIAQARAHLEEGDDVGGY